MIDAEGIIGFGAVIVGEFQDAFAVGPVVLGRRGGRTVVGEEVEIELCIGKRDVPDLGEAEEGVEFN